MSEPLIQSTVNDGVMRIVVDRPEKLNALSWDVIEQLLVAFGRAAEDESVRCVTLTGAGDRAFAAGADIGDFPGLDSTGIRPLINRGQDLMLRIERLGKPVIAAVNGFALGGGLELALACHLRIAATTARLGLPEVTLGLIPGYGGTQRLGRLVGTGRALEMMLTGKPVTAEQALEYGLVNAVVAPEDLEPAVERLAGSLSRSAPLAMKGILDTALGGAGLPLEDGLKLETDAFCALFDTADKLEGVTAFLEKRKPRFEGR